jgi:hypothetical protein
LPLRFRRIVLRRFSSHPSHESQAVVNLTAAIPNRPRSPIF